MKAAATRIQFEVIALTMSCAVLVTMIDGVLLQLRRDFFTGGFLSVDSAVSWSQRVAFALGSLAVDAACAGFGVCLAVALASWLRLGRVARWCLGAALGAIPLVLASLVEYQMVAHLGDAFDLGLMFELVGRRPSEILAVASGHVLAPAVAVLGGGGLLLAVVLALNRRFPAGVQTVRTSRALVVWAGVTVVTLVGMTLMRTTSDVLDNGLRRKPAGQLLGALVTIVTDVDRDGYGMLSRPADPAPFDARVYPYALEVPGNGVDEDGIGGDLLALAAPSAATTGTPAFIRKPDVVLVMLETFRADLLGTHEAGREVTPVLNALAAKGAAAGLAYSHNGYTVQSRYHLFTGRLGAAGPQGTLLEDFRRNGYEIAYFSAQDESFGGSAFDIGEERADVFYDARQDRERRYTTFTTAGSLGVSWKVLLERVAAFLAKRERSRPLFLYVNLYDTHFPYHHRDIDPLVADVVLDQSGIVPARAADLGRMYRNTAANVDRAIGALLDRMQQSRGAPPAVIVLADHGESLFDEGFLGHGYAINDTQTRIPLIASGIALDLCEPVGQADLRASIQAALVRTQAGDSPTFHACEGHKVFQYLGTLSRPRQIAHTGASGRLVYDLRSNRVRIDDGEWVALAEINDAHRAEWLALVHEWERLRLDDGTREADPS